MPITCKLTCQWKEWARTGQLIQHMLLSAGRSEQLCEEPQRLLWELHGLLPSIQFIWGNSDLRRSVKFTTGSSFAWIFHLCFFHSLKFLLQMKALQPAVAAGTAPPALLWLWTHSSKPRTATDSRGQSSACKNMSKPAFKVFINDVLAFPAQCTDPF